jgi:aryl-alcohol dehydrogenase-like predicted oxidoreductase
VAAARGASTGALALAWIIGHPECTAPVIGPARAAPHLGHVAAALALTLSAAEHAELGAWFKAAGAC